MAPPDAYAICNLASIKAFLRDVGVEESTVWIIPMAMKLVDAACITEIPGADAFRAVGSRLLYLVDYGAVSYHGDIPISLTPRGETLFDLRPPIKGVNG